MMISKFEEIKSGFIRQAKYQRSSRLFENDLINRVQSVRWGTWQPSGSSHKIGQVHETKVKLPDY